MPNLCLFTTGNDLGLLRQSCTRAGIELQAYNTNPHVWKDFLTTKLSWGLQFLRTRTEEYAMWVDGHDSLVIQPEEEILQRFMDTEADVLISGETNCWPSKEFESSFRAGGACYPNSGGYIGYCDALIAAMEEVIRVGDPGNDDQGAWHRAIATGHVDAEIDTERWIFASVGDGEEALMADSCVKHWNGRTPGREEWWREYGSSR